MVDGLWISLPMVMIYLSSYLEDFFFSDSVAWQYDSGWPGDFLSNGQELSLLMSGRFLYCLKRGIVV